MDVARPYSSIASGVEGDVLVVLAGTTGQLTGREVARLVRRGTSPSVSAALDRLVEQGLVHRQRAGRAYLHTLNRDHVASPVAELLAGLRGELLRRLRDALGRFAPAPIHASMFGSAARADGDAHSDVDLLIVRPDGVDHDEPDWREQLSGLSDAVYAWTGNHAAIVELAAADLDGLRRDPPPILAELRTDGIDLAGTPIRTLLQTSS